MKGKSEVKFVSPVEKKLDSMTEAQPKQMKDKKTKVKPPVTTKKDKKVPNFTGPLLSNRTSGGYETGRGCRSCLDLSLVRISAPLEVQFRSN